MKCPKCEAILEEDSKFCISCGARLGGVETEPANINPLSIESGVNQPYSTKQNVNVLNTLQKHKINFVGLVVGTIIIIVGIIRIMTAGTSISPTSFGGDFYTYTYQGIVAISEMIATLQVSLGWVIVAIGSAIDIISLRR